MKKTISILLVALAVVAMAFAGGEKESKTGAGNNAFQVPEGGYDGSPVTITFYHTMGSNLSEVLNLYIEEFNKLYPNITVNTFLQSFFGIFSVFDLLFLFCPRIKFLNGIGTLLQHLQQGFCPSGIILRQSRQRQPGQLCLFCLQTKGTAAIGSTLDPKLRQLHACITQRIKPLCTGAECFLRGGILPQCGAQQLL